MKEEIPRFPVSNENLLKVRRDLSVLLVNTIPLLEGLEELIKQPIEAGARNEVEEFLKSFKDLTKECDPHQNLTVLRLDQLLALKEKLNEHITIAKKMLSIADTVVVPLGKKT